MSYTAVATTGIYCRPGCPARPDPRNTRTYDLPAAAEAAGYRACLRCRPYRTDGPEADIGPELVCRAIRLVVDGALDHGRTEDDLAERLGVSARHLRRIFSDHTGCTPDQLARSRRAHFARRLLDDTDLPVTRIAYAAGYGSPRQLNRAFTETFRATPSELRDRRRVHDRLAADGGLTLRLAFTPPLDHTHLLAHAARRAIGGVEHVGGDVYRRTVHLAGDPGVLEILPGGSDHLLLRAHLPHWEGLIHIVHQARRIFGLAADPAVTQERFGNDPVLGPVVAASPGLRVPGTWDPFEVGIRAILGQQVSVTAASTLAARLVERHGSPVPGLAALGLTHLFPAPETLARADLDNLGLPGRRVDAIRQFARAVHRGDVCLDGSMPADDLRTGLVDLPGIGPWTAEYLALRTGEADAFPGTDLGLRQAYARLTGADEVPRDITDRAEAWRPHRAHAAALLWQSLV